MADNGTSPVRVLILTGANNHDWKATTPVLQKLFESSPRFKLVRVVSDPTKITSELLAGCDVLVSNWSAYPAMTGHQWGPVAEKAFVDWVRSGKGFVVFHAASATSQDWPEFQKLVGLTWEIDRTAHGAYSTFKVSVADSEHPITRGLTDFWITDELWHNMGSIGEQRFSVLAKAFSSVQWKGSGKFEPALLCTTLASGRGVNLVLGHDAHAMQNIGWQTLMLRSAEWAATGAVTLSVPADWPRTAAAAAVVGADEEAASKAVAAYRFGQQRHDLYLLEQLVNYATSLPGEAGSAARQRLAEKLAAALAGEAAPEAKAFVCRQICLVGSAAQVPAVAALLAQEATADAARWALERMAGSEAAKALRDALSSTAGKVQIGVINSLGDIRDLDAVPALSALLTGPDGQVAGAAAAALGRITEAGEIKMGKPRRVRPRGRQ